MKPPSKLPHLELVEFLFSYNPVTGILTRNKTGSKVGNNDRTTGYHKIRVGKITTQVSRIAWLLFYREDPIGYVIEHIDGNKRNNAIQNLRKVRYRLK